MHRFASRNIVARGMALWLALFLVCPGTAVSAGSDRVLPAGKITLYRGDQVIGVYTREAPLPEHAIISTEGRCAVRLEDLYLVAEDQSVFSISTSGRQRNLFIRQGVVYFKTAAMTHQLAFVTPNGQVSVQQIRIQAAYGDPTLKGYVAVTGKQSEVGVAEGGSMDVLTDDGPMTIQTGKKIVLAQADMDIGLPESEKPTADQPPETGKGWSTWSTGQKVAVGAIGAGLLVGAMLGLSGGGGGGDGGTVSPSSP